MKYLFLILFICPSLARAQSVINLNNPPAVPKIYSPGVISTGVYERDFALSPDNTEIFYTLQSPMGIYQTIVHRKKSKDGTWSNPAIAPFAGKYRDLEPAFSPDGKRLFFSSNRPVNGTEVKDVDIWYVEKRNGNWSEPINAGVTVNGPEDEYYPSITANGNLYFTAAYKNGVGKEDIYLARFSDTGWLKPEPVDTAVNSAVYEFNAYVSPDENFIIFTSYGRKDDTGRGDLYISKKSADNKWLPAKNLRMVNSARLDYCPFISPDNKSFFFSSERNALQSGYINKPVNFDQLLSEWSGPGNGNSDIYWVSFAELLKSLEQP